MVTIAIDTQAYPLRQVFPLLLFDRTTKKNIIFATESYEAFGDMYGAKLEITPSLLSQNSACIIQPRVLKNIEEQQQRTRKKAEVFTPAWVCCMMNDHCDTEWFGRDGVFGKLDGQEWHPCSGRIEFPKGKKWQTYVDSRRLEITCGEAPYIVSRYDMGTGEPIPIEGRIGILDRKLRVVGENTESEEEWLKWAKRAFQSVYGYEYQGDNLFVARINLLLTFTEYLEDRWKRKATDAELDEIAKIISWNIWQMDGLKGTIPLGALYEAYKQLSLFDLFDFGDKQDEPEEKPPCRIFDWRGQKKSIEFNAFKTGGNGSMKFDYIIGNPPYQEEQENNNKAEAIYHYFYDSVSTLSDKYLLISPARFLFNAGMTPKAWNEKMLSDEHLKVVEYYSNSTEVFTNVNLPGGVAIMYRDAQETFGAIGFFTPNSVLQKLSKRFSGLGDDSMSSIVFGGRSDLKFNDRFFEVFPDARDYILRTIQAKHPSIMKLGPNEEYEIKSSSFERTPFAFLSVQPDDTENYYKILGIEKGKRVFKWVLKEYLSPRFPEYNNIGFYKVFLSNADGAAGQIGKPIPARIIGKPLVAQPYSSSIPTFMSIGRFQSEDEAVNAEKYVQTKFVRALIGILKVTQHITPSTWQFVPLQDFTPASDIDWSQPVAGIDQQLYRKYGLSDEEIAFIETHVKEMA